jgi:hypothetical protein
LTTAGIFMYYMVTMLSLSNHRVSQPAVPPIQRSIFGVLSDPLPIPAQLLDKSKLENEAEQFIEKALFTEAKKAKLSNLLKTKGSVEARFFVKSEAEHFIENKRH